MSRCSHTHLHKCSLPIGSIVCESTALVHLCSIRAPFVQSICADSPRAIETDAYGRTRVGGRGHG